MPIAPERYSIERLRDLSMRLLAFAGTPRPKAEAITRALIHAEIVGHTTHGLILLPLYLQKIHTAGCESEAVLA